MNAPVELFKKLAIQAARGTFGQQTSASQSLNRAAEMAKLRKLSHSAWSLEKSVLLRDRLKANGASRLSTAEISM